MHYARLRKTWLQCEVDGCEKGVTAKGLCPMHYRRWREWGSFDPRPRAVAFCSVAGCPERAKSKGMCGVHYDRARKEDTQCSIDGCGNRLHALDMCSKHYFRTRKYGTIFRFSPIKAVTFCSFGQCDRISWGRQEYCQAHYMQSRKPRPMRELATGACETCGASTKYGNRVARYCSDCRGMWHQLKHGLSPEQAREVRREGGTCAICFRVRPLRVDHDHDCCDGPTSCGNCIRGFICGPCNTGMGMLDDHHVLAMRAAIYLLAYKAKGEATEIARHMTSLTDALLSELAPSPLTP